MHETKFEEILTNIASDPNRETDSRLHALQMLVDNGYISRGPIPLKYPAGSTHIEIPLQDGVTVNPGDVAYVPSFSTGKPSTTATFDIKLTGSEESKASLQQLRAELERTHDAIKALEQRLDGLRLEVAK